MADREWEKFFELLDKIVNSDAGSWGNKKADVISHASEADETNLGELANWFAEN